MYYYEDRLVRPLFSWPDVSHLSAPLCCIDHKGGAGIRRHQSLAIRRIRRDNNK